MLFFCFYFINKINSININIKRILKKGEDNLIFLNNNIFQRIYHILNSKNLNNNKYSMKQVNDITNINMLYPFKSRPLGFEDVILFYIFPDIKNGFSIDFGGYHPEKFQSQNFFIIN